MKGTKIWIPGEQCDGGLLVTDAATGAELYVTEGEVGTLVVPVKAGRFVAKPAVRGAMLRSEGGHVVAKLADGRTVAVKVVAGWQLGDGKPPAAEFTPPDRDAPSDSVAESAA